MTRGTRLRYFGEAAAPAGRSRKGSGTAIHGASRTIWRSLNIIHTSWIKDWKDTAPGDVIFADWTGSSFAHISHAGIITGMRTGQPLITQHTPSQRNIPLSYWLTHGGPQRRCLDGPDEGYRSAAWD